MREADLTGLQLCPATNDSDLARCMMHRTKRALRDERLLLAELSD